MNYFDLLGINESFHLDTAELKRKYYHLSKSLHPDLLQNSSTWENQASVLETEKINMAYETLKDPFKRLKHLLEIHDVLNENQNVDQSFLMEVMEINENIMELEMESNIELLKNTQKLWNDLSQSIDTEIQPYLQKFNEGDRSQENFAAIKRIFFKIKIFIADK
ncbi:MAG: Fe-S protein assembly co-chaperone HscB [Saprospiraceae bacterium]